MNLSRKHLVVVAVMALAAIAAATSVDAQTFGRHPALRSTDTAPAAPGIDPNTFIVAHPAGLALVHGHANHEHPAVAASREAQSAQVDPNLFIVQPPASVQWTLAPDVLPVAQVALSR